MALDAGAQPYGHWSGCHAIAWDAAAPPTGDRELLHRLSKHSYPIGIVVNRDGQRFVDEGADFRNYTYAKYGAEVLKQPGAVAYQLFDARTGRCCARTSTTRRASRAPRPTRSGSSPARSAIDPGRLARTVAEFNAAAQPGPFDPSIKDGKRTVGIDPPKSNWALPLDTPPFLAFAVTCGITFTSAACAIDRDARVLDAVRPPDPGPLRRRRAGRRPLLPQLPGRHRPGRVRLRPPRRLHGRRAGQAPGARAGVSRRRRPATATRQGEQ